MLFTKPCMNWLQLNSPISLSPIVSTSQTLSSIPEAMLNFYQILPLEPSHYSSQPRYHVNPEAFSLLS